MNERIQKLMDQSLNVNWYGFLDKDCVGQFTRSDLKRFAELIVRECANIVQDSPWQLPQGYKSVDQAKLVRKYFGVE